MSAAASAHFVDSTKRGTGTVIAMSVYSDESGKAVVLYFESAACAREFGLSTVRLDGRLRLSFPPAVVCQKRQNRRTFRSVAENAPETQRALFVARASGTPRRDDVLLTWTRVLALWRAML